MSKTLYKECELRRFGPVASVAAEESGVADVERATRWIAQDDAVIGRLVRLTERGGGEWEIVSAPDPALPGCLVRRYDPSAIDDA